MKQYTTEELWQAVEVLDNASQYLADDAGERDVYWTEELNEACQVLNRLANEVRAYVSRREQQ